MSEAATWMTKGEKFAVDRLPLEIAEGWFEIIQNVPYFEVPPNCTIAILPPCRGVTARIRFKRGDRTVSMFLDWYARYFVTAQEPYFEISSPEGEEQRFFFDDLSGITAAIDDALG